MLPTSGNSAPNGVAQSYPPFVALLTANVVSVVGGAMSFVALPWFVFATTGSSVRTGITTLCEFIPVVLMSFLSGSVVARLGPRRTRVLSDVVSGITVLTIPILHATVGITFGLLLILVAVNGLLRTPAVTASLMLLRDLGGRTPMSRERATGIYLASVRIAIAAGAPLAGVLIAAIGAPGVLAADAATFLLSALILTLFTSAAGDVTAAAPAERSTAGAGLRSGLRAIGSDRLLALIVSMSVIFAMVQAGWSTVAAPMYGHQVLHSPTLLGLLFGAFGLGAVAGNLGYAWVARYWSRHRVLWVALLMVSAPGYLALAAELPAPVLLVAMTAAGLGMGTLSPLYIDLQYDRIEPQLQGHVFGLTGGLEQAGTALGALAAGLILALLPLNLALLASALVGLVLTAVALLAPAFRPLKHSPGPVPPAGPDGACHSEASV